MTIDIAYLAGNTIIILLAGFGAYMKLRDRMTRIEVQNEFLVESCTLREESHRTLREKVDGISRHVIEVETRLDERTQKS